jgi:hypothetical protein
MLDTLKKNYFGTAVVHVAQKKGKDSVSHFLNFANIIIIKMHHLFSSLSFSAFLVSFFLSLHQ